MENNSEYKLLSFLELLKKEEKIEIPIIQRDYAQGRKESGEVRANFLNALYECIVEDNDLRLDFIYGSIVDGNFQPLDGQQRLTTLFLMHWYAATKDNCNEDIFLSLSKFSYETRITSREFCNALTNNKIKIEESDKISDKIQDEKWFFLSWKNDPTIDAMLRTIDDIHEKFYNIENLWTKLSNGKILNFYYVELENIGLTDDLYIKMNARGKLLSSFENFKASFEKYINENNWEENVNDLDKFALKIDTKWTDYFWNNFRKNDNIDNSLMRFISTISMIRMSIEKKIPNRTSVLSILHDDSNKLKPSYFSEDGFNYLFDCFKLYCENNQNNDLQLDFPLWRHKPEKDLLNEIVYIDKEASYTQKALFFAQTEYLLMNNEFNENKYKNWMRVIRNIVSRGNIEKGGKRPDILRSPETFDGCINLISELSKGSGDIYNYLINNNKLNSQFAREQIEEERKKAHLILYDDSFKKTIFNLEDCSLFKGRIQFVFECLDYNENLLTFNIEKADKIYKIIKDYFDNDNSDKISNEIRRALFTIEIEGIYEFYTYWWSYWNIGNAHKRCLIENFRELEYYIYNTENSNYLKKLIQKMLDDSLSNIIDKFIPPTDMPNWKIRLIKEQNLLNNYNKSNYIAIPDDNSCCFLLNSKRPREMSGCYKID
ncbi:DUF262 domain-containing protein [Flavobacterium ponti]|uniref:DUF262 domain-containing protein n=1 Tax=Flavobacterium ponti TaxID=665133 RepID=A0ABV9P044_9FLAO